MRLLALDIETTSLNKEHGHILEIGLIKALLTEDKLEVLDKFRIVFLNTIKGES